VLPGKYRHCIFSWATIAVFKDITSAPLIVLAASQRRCTVNTHAAYTVTVSWWWIVTLFETCREVIIGINWERKVHLLDVYYASILSVPVRSIGMTNVFIAWFKVYVSNWCQPSSLILHRLMNLMRCLLLRVCWTVLKFLSGTMWFWEWYRDHSFCFEKRLLQCAFHCWLSRKGNTMLRFLVWRGNHTSR